MIDENEDTITKARKAIDMAFKGLEKQGLAVHVKGVNLCFEWDGISLTRAGVAMAQQIKEEIYQEFLADQAAKTEKRCKIKCLGCGEISLQTTSRFRSDNAVTGNMIEFLPDLSQAGWSVSFGPSDSGEAITCPNCGEVLIDHDSFRFKEGVLIDPEEIETD